MANTNAPFGFLPARHLAGGVVRMNAIGQYYMTSGLASNLFAGDVVKQLNTGPYIDRAGATDASLIGVWAGVQFINPLDQRPWWTDYWATGQTTVGAVDANAFIFDDPQVIFTVQAITGTAFTATMIGNNSRLAATAGNTTTRRSAESLDVANVGTSTDQFRILNLAAIPGNALGDSAVVEVRFNQHLQASTTGV